MNAAYQLVLCDMFILLCYTTQNHQHRRGWPCPQWAGPSYINQQSKWCPNNIPQINLLEAINQSIFSFQGTWKFVAKLTKITSTNRWMCPKVKRFLFVFCFIFSLLHTKFFKIVSTNKRFSQYISFWDAWKRRKFINLQLLHWKLLSIIEHLLCIQQDAEWYISNNLFNSPTVVWE